MPTVRGALTALVLVVLAGPALVLTGLRLVQPDVGWAIKAVAFAPYALLCFAVVAVVLGLLATRAVRARAGARTVTTRLGALLLVAVLAALHVGWVVPSFAGPAPEAAPGSPRLRVLTLNVLHGSGTGALVHATVEDTDADVVVLQEVTASIWEQLSATGTVRTHPHVVGLEPDGRPGTMVLSRRPLGSPERLGTDGDSLVVPVLLGQRTVRLMGVHPRNALHPTLWRDDHAALAAAIKEIRPAVVAGDFNATFDHAPMRRYRDQGYRSAAEILNTGWQPTWPNNGHSEVLGVPLPRLVHIDHVLVARGLTATSVRHLDVPRSDHMGVLAEVALR